jgi:predicted alpha/beta-fold hydrolase
MTAPRPFLPPFWLRNGHVQTLGAALPLWAWRDASEPTDEVVTIAVEPGHALHALRARAAREGPREAVVVVHGVGGSSESRYVLRARRALVRGGYDVLRLDLRGAGRGAPLSSSLYHAGLTSDLTAAVVALSGMDRVSGVHVLGFSLGGHLALRWAGERGADVPRSVLRVAAVSAPTDLDATTRWLERVRSAPYHSYVLRGLLAQARRALHLHAPRLHFTGRQLDRLRTVRDYDRAVIAPMHGFDSSEDYYARTSAGPLLRSVQVPTLVVHAVDDPLVPGHLVRPDLLCASPAVTQAWSDRGGHVGWFAGLDEVAWTRTWAVDAVLRFLAGK